MLATLAQAYPNPYNTGKPNSAFYLPSNSVPSAIPSACITWDDLPLSN